MSEKKQKKNKKRLFSRALFKQSCKANGTMWLIITVAVCFMLACVMLISGTSSVSSVKEGIQDTIIEKTIESSVKKSAVNLYKTSDDAEYIFDKAFAEKIAELNTKANYQKISNITTSATNEATELVTDYVTPLIEEEVKDRLTPKATAYVSEKATAKVKEVISGQVASKVQSQSAAITSDVTTAVASDMANYLISQDVLGTSYSDFVNGLSAAITQATASKGSALTDYETYTVTMTYLGSNYNGKDTEFALKLANKVSAAMGSTLSPSMSQTQAVEYVLSNDSEIQSLLQSKVATYSTKAQEFTASETETVKNKYIAAATAEYSTSENQTAVTKDVLAKYQDQWISEATEKYKDETVEEVKEDKLDKYTSEAKEQLSSQINSISNKATDKVTDIITEVYIKPAYEYAVDQVMAAYPEDEDESAYGAAMVTINPDNQADDQYTDNNETIPDEYINALTDYISADITAWSNGKATNTLTDYIETEERASFRHNRAYNAVSMLIGSNITSDDSKQEIIDKLADYDVDEEKYDSFGFDYEKCKDLAYEATSSYQEQFDYEVSRISDSIKQDKTQYDKKVQEIKDDAYDSTSSSFLDSLPQDVTDGLQELGTMDLYGLIVGSIFFKMAGLLLPIIYIIMVSNNLIASQVDTGSMAYILSTSTRRKEVTFTQGLYLIGSTLLMFVCTTITSCVCFSLIDVNTDITYEKLILINLGAFVTMLAISGINFLCSCIFDRSKRAMAIGGGVSIFFLVATMLGLFGSPVIPSVVRIKALNNFNYVSLISLFDVISILDGTNVWMYKLVILFVIGMLGYIIGSIIFKKKDLPL